MSEQILVKPSDSRSWSLCKRRVWLDHKLPAQHEDLNDFDKLVVQLGIEHEKNILSIFESKYTVEVAQSVTHTETLMHQGIDVIYQAQLININDGIIGYPDFLIRQSNGEYQAADAKLSLSSEKKEIQIQLGLYRQLLNNGLSAIVFLGDGSQSEINNSSDGLVIKFVTEMHALLTNQQEPIVRYSHSKCSACPYYEHCKPLFVAKNDLSLLYGIQARAAEGLEAIGIQTITDLSLSSADELPDIPYLKGFKKKQRAIFQAKSWESGEMFSIGTVSLPKGTWVHFDIEDNPLTANGEKHVYLWGFLLPNYANENFEYVWTDNENEDKDGWLAFLEKIQSYHLQYSDLILAHYSSHERTTIKKYAERYEMENDETVSWLLGDTSPLFDMQRPVTDNLILPLQGYGLKDICKHPDLVNFQWEDADSGSQWSVVQFNNFLNEKDAIKKELLKKEILGYNRDDVIATRRLEQWLRKNHMTKPIPKASNN